VGSRNGGEARSYTEQDSHKVGRAGRTLRRPREEDLPGAERVGGRWAWSQARLPIRQKMQQLLRIDLRLKQY